MPQENPPVENATDNTEHRRSGILNTMNKYRKSFIFASFLAAGAEKVAINYGPGIVYEMRVGDERKSLNEMLDKENELNKLFGDHSPMSLAKQGIAELDEAKERYSNPFKDAGLIDCPVCGHKHAKDAIFCSRTGEIIEGYKEPESDNKEVGYTEISTKEGDISSSDLKQLVATLPDGWTRGNFSGITQVDEKMPHIYEGLEDMEMLASYNRIDKAIKFYGPVAEHMTFEYITASIDHEIAHSNDWGSPRIDYKTRLQLLVKLSKRINAEDRFKSSYVESIRDKDAHENNYHRAVEYWAEITAQYFKDPTKLNIEDFNIVNEHVHKMDPSFDWQKYHDARQKIVGEIALKINDTKNIQ